MPRYTRQKASDVFRGSTPLFGKITDFDEAFPEIDNVTIVVEQYGDGVNKWNQTQHRHKHSAGEYFDCSNPRCYNGGIRTGLILREMVRKRTRHHEESRSCQGYEGSPKGRRNYGPCFNSFKVTVDIEYKEADNENA